MSIAALFTIAKSQKQPECPLNEWISKMQSIHTTGYEPALKGRKFWHATTQRSLEDTMLRKISQLQKDKYCPILLL